MREAGIAGAGCRTPKTHASPRWNGNKVHFNRPTLSESRARGVLGATMDRCAISFCALNGGQCLAGADGVSSE